MDDFIDQRDIEILERNLDKLPPGFRKQAQAIIDGKDLTGGMIDIQQQIYILMAQVK